MIRSLSFEGEAEGAPSSPFASLAHPPTPQHHIIPGSAEHTTCSPVVAASSAAETTTAAAATTSRISSPFSSMDRQRSDSDREAWSLSTFDLDSAERLSRRVNSSGNLDVWDDDDDDTAASNAKSSSDLFGEERGNMPFTRRHRQSGTDESRFYGIPAAAESWYALMKMPPLENEGSTARDHLANERTYLAWLRTAVGAVGLGLAVAKLGLVEHGELAGTIFIVSGMIFLVYSTFRYLRMMHLLTQKKFQPNKLGVIVVSAVTFFASLVAFLLTWWGIKSTVLEA